MKPHDIKIEEYNYDLPENRIPKYPLDRREQSKLLVYKNEEIQDHTFKDLKNHLPKDTFLIFNDSKVLPVRIHFENSNGRKIEVFCLESISEEENKSTWKCFVGNAAKWKEQTLSKEIEGKIVSVELEQKEKDHCIVVFSWNHAIDSMLEVLELFGQIPIPPYLKRDSEEIDNIRYQNVFAHHNGSVAAPTAGLHFTKDIIRELKQTGVKIDFVTLHVGAGTFKPVKSETIGEHEMHVEKMLLTRALIDKLYDHISRNEKITSVGTTTLRTLESLYWLGNKMFLNENLSKEQLQVDQWSPYTNDKPVSTIDSLVAIKNWMDRNEPQLLTFSTKLLILPSYKFRMIDCLITNFHQPKSTLLLLVSAAVGPKWNTIYKNALNQDYRFLSYGDSSLLFIDETNLTKGISL